ncbi:adrenoceptor alpha 2C [Phyllostomus discolor]|uniref:Alpha-2C adrenergic receptor n=1 Tax=Phyllostomus discolor TaxID=89673 RepID=A0A834EQN6_9CHIR|nr:adrenoceptor alpha 2C [Phyllostomus discolor]
MASPALAAAVAGPNASDAGEGGGSGAANASGVAWGPPPSQYLAGAVAGLATVVSFLIVFTVVGNVLVVIALLTSRALRAPQNLFLVSLASADILVATLVMPFSLANELIAYWYFGQVWCGYVPGVRRALLHLLHRASVSHQPGPLLVRDAGSRVQSEARAAPHQGHDGGLVAHLGRHLLPTTGLTLRKPDGAAYPQCVLNEETWYILSSCICSFFAPCLIMGLVYVRVYCVAKLRTRTLSEKHTTQGPDGASLSAEDWLGAPTGADENRHCAPPRRPRSDVDPEDSSSVASGCDA